MSAITPTPARTRGRRPHWAWFLLCPVLAIGGIVLGVVAGIDEVRDITRSFHRFEAGTGTVQLETGDEPTVWGVRPDDGEVEADAAWPRRPQATVVVTGPDGAPAAFRPAGGGTTTFTGDAFAAIDLGTFRADRDGRYRVAVTYDDPEARAADTTAGVGELHLGRTARRVLAPIVLGIGGAVLLMLVLIWMRWRDGRRERRIAADPLRSASDGPITFG